MIYTSRQVHDRVAARAIPQIVGRGELVRAGRYYVTPDTDEGVRAALTAGLRPTCVTAAEQHGLWVPPAAGLHVYGRRRQVGAGWVGHGWHPSWPESSPIASPRLLLEHSIRCLDPLEVGILADSALYNELVDQDTVAELAATAPRGVRRVLERASGKAQSGTESKVRLFLLLHNVVVTPQVWIPGVGYVDNLAGRRWIIECDSRQHHTGKDNYAKDRARDLRALELGYFTTRLTHAMTFAGWARTSATLMQVIRSGRHLDPPERWAL